MPSALQIIQLLVAPVVLISANGLICLAIYNRMTAISARARAFHKEWFELFAQYTGMDEARQAEPDAKYLFRRIEMLHDQGHRVMRRARLVRDCLLCLLTTVLCMLACSLALGAAAWIPRLDWLAVALFYLGVVVMMAGVAMAIFELRLALDPLALEHDMMEASHGEWAREGNGETV